MTSVGVCAGNCNCNYTGYRYDLSRGWHGGERDGDRELAGVYDCERTGGAEREHVGDDWAGGALSLQLVPNAGSTPMGSYYTAVYHLDDGRVSREYWVVPVSAVPVRVSAIESTVLPTSVAMQTVSKAYVDTAIAAAVTGHPLDELEPYVLKAGDTMTGPLVLAGRSDGTDAGCGQELCGYECDGVGRAGWGRRFDCCRRRHQTVTQPVGTQLQVNNLNGIGVCEPVCVGVGEQRDCECGDEPGLRERMRCEGGA